MDLTEQKVAAFGRLFADVVAQAEQGAVVDIDYHLPAPRWQFLCWVCDTKDILLHGSGNSDIEEFEPRKSNDMDEFGNRTAVYAASDGIWAMYFAIVDRERYVRSLMNACFRAVAEDGSRSEPYYFFSINGDALPHNPWRTATIYLLPRDTFEQQPVQRSRGYMVEIQQWASPVAVRPMAKLAVGPEDFPFLSRIYGHDVAVIQERAERDPGGFPWLDP